MARSLTLWTVGHSVRPLEVFLGILRAHGIERLVDVRARPVSRRHPHFNRDRFAASLAAAGIAYVGMPELGGLRAPRPDSPNRALEEDAFRGFADHMGTPAFETSLARLEAEAREAPTAFMCAEANPKDCHRSLISDALVARGRQVVHLLAEDRAEPHVLTPSARIDGARVSYPAPGLFDAAPPKPAKRPRRA